MKTAHDKLVDILKEHVSQQEADYIAAKLLENPSLLDDAISQKRAEQQFEKDNFFTTR